MINFLQSHPESGGYPCWRYNTAISMLENIGELNIPYFRDICDATHQGGSFHTQYPKICDLKHGTIYLFHNRDYNHLKIFNLSKEIKLGPHFYHISELVYDDTLSPFKPVKPLGPIYGKTGVEYTYRSSSTDPDNGQIYYLLIGEMAQIVVGWAYLIQVNFVCHDIHGMLKDILKLK